MRKHGHSVGGHSPTYSSWNRMRQRCGNPNSTHYGHYGGRGIKVCPQWRRFEQFLADMGERPLGHTLDRTNNDGDYEPDNCRWATPKQQAVNKRPKTRRKVLRPACYRGHMFTDDNTRINPRGERVCKKCDALRSLAYYHKNKKSAGALR